MLIAYYLLLLGDNDLLVGVCDLGKLYVVKNALNMKLAY